MQPIKLTMKAFGPFLDETVNFSELGEDLFLISGPTGSGKTTIFDGICYALYGEASSADRMPDGMKSDFAPVAAPCSVDLFFSAGRKKYHIHRLPHQQMTNRQHTGLKEQKHEASLWECDGPDEKLIASSVRDCDAKIREIIGLTANQFRQIIMLPQGQFSKLLKSSEKERVELLKTLFSMDYYKAFETKLDAKAREARAACESIETQIDVERSHLSAPEGTNLADALNEDTALDVIIDLGKRQVIHDRQEVKRLDQETEGIALKQKALEEILISGQNLIERFDLMESRKKEAASLKEQENAMKVLKNKIDITRKSQKIAPIEKQYIREKERYQKAVENRRACSERLARIEKRYDNLKPQFDKIEAPEFEAQIESSRKTCRESKTSLEDLEHLIALNADINQLSVQIEEMDLRLKSIDRLREERSSKTDQITKIQSAVAEAQTAFNDTIRAVSAQDRKSGQIDEILERFSEIDENNAAVDGLYDQRKALRKQYDKALKEQRKLEKRQINYAVGKIALSLTEGEPCPVCGSIHHPAPAQENDIAVKDNIDALDDLRKNISEISGKLSSLDDREKFYTAQNKKLRGEIDELAENAVDDNHTNFLLEWIDTAINGGHITKNEALKAKEASIKKASELKDRQQDYQKKITGLTDEQNNLRKSIDQIVKTIEGSSQLEEHRDAKKSALDEMRGEASGIRNRLTQSGIETDGQDTEAVYEMLRKKMADAGEQIDLMQKKRKNLRETKESLTKDRASAAASSKNAAKTVEECQTALADAKRDFENALVGERLESSVYDDHKNIEETVLADWVESYEDYQKKVEIVNSRIKDLSVELSGKTRPDLTKQQKEKENFDKMLETLRTSRHEASSRAENNDTQVKRLEDLSGQRKEARERQAVFDDLNQTVRGTLKGHQKLSFERYILSAYLQDILVSANVFLSSISDGRYHLMLAGNAEADSETDAVKAAAKNTRGLAIEVYDDFTGKSRAASSLSGGETFMAALSMALGLSDMVQSRAGTIQLGTLFVDEGFATLDTNSLDKAMDCLTRLQRKGRMVGIISHVTELIDLVDAKIIVEKTEAGSHIKVVRG